MTGKTYVIERLFRKRWDAATGTLSNPIVTLTDIQEAINEHNTEHPDTRLHLSSRNPANFFKDFFRNRIRANSNWPAFVLEQRYTARQVTGGNSSFEFVALEDDQAEPFPLHSFTPSASTARHQIESVSLPLTTRRLGRGDETWLIQALVRLRVLESHFALFSALNVVQLDHLQMGIKLRRTEIDALYLAVVDPLPETEVEAAEEQPIQITEQTEVIVTCEAKGLKDDILLGQVVRQIQAVFSQRAVKQDIAVATAVKSIGPSEVYVVEFAPIRREDAAALETLEVASEAIYTLVPPVPGIGV